PMPLGAALVVDAMIGNAPAVRHSRIAFQREIDIGAMEGLDETDSLFRRKRSVDARHADMDAPLDRARQPMRAVLGLAGEIAAMETRRRDDPVRIGAGRRDRAAASEAITDRALRSGRTGLVEGGDEGAGVGGGHRLA